MEQGNFPRSVAISPDGEYVVYVGINADNERYLWLYSSSKKEQIRLDDTLGARFPFWRGDSKEIGYFSDGLLKTIAVAGGPSRIRCRAEPAPFGGAWCADGTFIFSPNARQRLVRLAGIPKESNPTNITEFSSGEIDHAFPVMMWPEGDQFLFLAVTAEDSSVTRMQSLNATASEIVLTNHSTVAFWKPYILFEKDKNIFKYNLETRRFDADPIAQMVGKDKGVEAYFSVSTNGKLAYHRFDLSEYKTVLTNLSERSIRHFPTTKARVENPDFSPDGKHIIWEEAAPQKSREIWTIQIDGKNPTCVLRGSASYFHPLYCPSNAFIYVQEPENGKTPVFRRTLTDGVDQLGKYLFSITNLYYGLGPITSDGRFLLYVTLDPESKTRADIGMVNLDAHEQQWKSLAATSAWETTPTVSPDAKWLAFASNEDHHDNREFEIYIQSFPQGERKKRISNNGGINPAWNPKNAKELFYMEQGVKIMRKRLDDDNDPTEVCRFTNEGPSAQFQNLFRVHPDGDKFLIQYLIPTGTNRSIFIKQL
jgi:Tol biopolymer transport system component